MKNLTIFILKIVKITTSSFIQILLCVVAITIFSTLAVVIDPSFPQNNTGTDMLSAYGYVQWVNRFFPDVPFWYPLQGAGVSFMAGYQWLSFMIVVGIHKLTSIPIFPIFNTLRFISFPLTAFGIFVFCWTRLQYPRQTFVKQIIGLIAGVFYLIAPTSWYWSYKWGFYAESVSIMFIPPALIFADWFVDLSFKGDTSIKKRIALLGALLFYILAFLTHFGAGFGLSHIIPLMILTRCAYEIKRQRTEALKKAVITGFIFFSLFLLTFAWRLVPYLEYTNQSKIGGYAGDLFVKEVSTEPNRPTLKQMAQLEYLYQPDYRFIFNEFSIPLSLWILAGFAAVLGPIRTQKMLYLGIASVFGLTAYTYIHDLSFVYLRSLWTLFRVVIPIVAAYGGFILGDCLLFLFDFIFKKIHHRVDFLWKHGARPLIVLTLTVLVTGGILYTVEVKNSLIYTSLPKRDALIIQKNPLDTPLFRIANNRVLDPRDIWGKPKPILNEEEKDEKKRAIFKYYDPHQFELNCNANTKVDEKFNNICDEFILNQGILTQRTINAAVNYCKTKNRQEVESTTHWCLNFYLPLEYQLDKRNWPQLKFSEPEKPVINPKDNLFFSHIPQKPLETRFDLSAKTGSMIMQSPLLTDVSQSQVYVHELNLFAALWNYQSSVMYADQPINQKPGVISELAKYFGYEYILAITNSDTALNQYKSDSNWENIVVNENTQNENKDWWRFKYPTGLTTWTKKSAVLFIADQKHYLYDQAFKTANLGVIPYDKAITFAGTEYVDDYSLSSLQQFNVLYLEGYKYHDEKKARDMLDNYVKNGGNLFIDTGWQFNNPDWQLTDAPGFFPSNSFEWKVVGPSAHLIVDNTSSINYSPVNKDIGPLTLPPASTWGISTPKDIRKGAQVIVQTNNNPLLIAKEYGKGKVIWSGMNSIMHIEGGKNENLEEISLLKQSINWLLNNSSSDDLNVKVTRSNPDEIKFQLNESTETYTTLYFRESFYPYWAAEIKHDNKTTGLQVFNAGPRFMGIRIPPAQKDSQVRLYFKTPLTYLALNALATTTTIFLVLYLLGIVSVEKIIPNIAGTKKRVSELREEISMKVHEDPNEEIPENPQTSI